MSKKVVKNVKCKVCGAPCREGATNCGVHAYVSDRMTPLARAIYTMDKIALFPSTDLIKALAVEHQCSEGTVRRHLKAQGFQSVRGWRYEK